MLKFIGIIISSILFSLLITIIVVCAVFRVDGYKSTRSYYSSGDNIVAFPSVLIEKKGINIYDVKIAWIKGFVIINYIKEG